MLAGDALGACPVAGPVLADGAAGGLACTAADKEAVAGTAHLPRDGGEGQALFRDGGGAAGCPLRPGQAHGIGGEHRYRRDAPGEADPASGPGSVAGAECLLRLSGDAGGGAGAVGSAGRAAGEDPLHGAGTHLRHAGYLPHRGRPGVGHEPPDGLRGVRPGRPRQRSYGDLSDPGICPRRQSASDSLEALRQGRTLHGAGCSQASGSPIDHLCGAPHGPAPSGGRPDGGGGVAVSGLCGSALSTHVERGDHLCPGDHRGGAAARSGDGAAEKQGTGGAAAAGAASGGEAAVLLYPASGGRAAAGGCRRAAVQR